MDLIRSNEQQQRRTDIVDWPKGERDGYVFAEVNTVVNAFHLAAMKCMADLARALGKDDDAEEFDSRTSRTHAEFQRQLFDSKSGLYRDGIGTDHSSHHANFFPLVFGLVPDGKRHAMVDWLKTRDMHCSVYAAQYLLEGLFSNGGDEKAIALITAATDRKNAFTGHAGLT